MWFNNIRIYVLTEALDITHEALAEHPFTPCGSLDLTRYGFVPPIGKDFIHQANGCTMFCAKRQEKILPSAAIKDKLDAKVQAIQDGESRTVGRKERSTLKDEIIFSLLPNALTKSSLDYAYLDAAAKILVVNSPSAKRAEDLISALREALGSVKAIPFTPKSIPTQVMTHWVRGDGVPEHFELGENVELRAGKDGRVIRCKNQDLSAGEVLAHLDSGMYVSRLALTWNESISFTLDDQIAIKGIKFADKILEQSNERNPETKAEQFDSDFTIMTLQLRQMLVDLAISLGGVDSPVNNG